MVLELLLKYPLRYFIIDSSWKGAIFRMHLKEKFAEFLKQYLLLILVAGMIVSVSIINHQAFFKTLPTLISLLVQVLLVRADRKAFLLGGLNSFLYAFAYMLDGVYFSAISALIISGPGQLFSFFHWKKNSVGDKVRFKTLGMLGVLAALGITLLMWAGVFFGLSRFFNDATYPVVDTLGFTLGVLVTILSAFRYVESQYFSLINCVISLTLWILIAAKNPAGFNYVIISLYNFYQVARAAVNWTHQYRAAKNESAPQNETEAKHPC